MLEWLVAHHRTGVARLRRSQLGGIAALYGGFISEVIEVDGIIVLYLPAACPQTIVVAIRRNHFKLISKRHRMNTIN